MAELWSFLDNAPVSYFLIIGLVAIGISYLLDVLADDAKGGWR